MNIGPVPITPIWREAMFPLELRSLLRHPLFTEPAPAPEPLPVMLIPGFLTGDAQLAALGSWLRRCGHRTHRSGIRLNVDCSAAAVERLEQRLEEFVRVEREPAVLIGQSRGGLFARVLGVRRPDLVRTVVTLGSPHRNPFAVHPLVWTQGAAIAGLGTLGVPGLATHRCRNGGCCHTFMQDLRRRFPAGIEFLSVHSQRDGIVDWRACHDPAAANVEVPSTHCGMAVNVRVYELLDAALHSARRRRAPGRGKSRAAQHRRSSRLAA